LYRSFRTPLSLRVSDSPLSSAIASALHGASAPLTPAQPTQPTPRTFASFGAVRPPPSLASPVPTATAADRARGSATADKGKEDKVQYCAPIFDFLHRVCS
jgi:hypothetical protein